MIDKNDPRLTAFLLDELTPEEAAVVESALDESPELQTHVKELRSTIGVLKRVCDVDHSEDDEVLTPEQLRQLDAVTSAGAPATSDKPDDGLAARIRWRNFAIAALLLYAVGMSVFAFRRPALITAQSHYPASETPIRSPIDTGGVNAEEWERTRQVITGDNDVLLTDLYGTSDEQSDRSEPENMFLGYSDQTVADPIASSNPSPASDPFGGADPLGAESPIAGADRSSDSHPFGEDSATALTPDEPSDFASSMTDVEPSASQGMSPDRPYADGESRVSNTISNLRSEQGPTGHGADESGDGGLAEMVDRVSGRERESEADGLATAETTPEQIAAVRIRNVELAKAAEEVQKKLNEAQATRKAKTWKPATAATNRARLSVGHHDDLALAARDTYVRIDGFRARVFFDLYYYNDRPQQLEGQFMLRLPSDASLHYFAFGPTPVPTPDEPPPTGKPGEPANQLTAADGAVNALRKKTATTGSDLARRASDPGFAAEQNTVFGLVKAARVVPRQKAALAYDETVRRRVDPALVEWAGPGIFQTRVFPLVPNQLHRIVVGYDVMLRDDGDDRVFSLNLPDGEAGGRVEFDIAATAGSEAVITPETDAFVSGGRAYYRFLDAQPRDYTVRLTGAESVVLKTAGSLGDAYFATRLIANLPDAAAETDSPRAVFLLDTSWSDRPAAFSRRLKLLEQILEQNRDTLKEFAVLMFNVEQRWWQKKFVANTASNVAELLKVADQLALEGATDLYGALTEATKPAWLEQPDTASPQPNYFLLSDAAATWGKTDLASLADPLSQSDRSSGGGALFAYHLAGHRSDKATLQWLADASGGAVFDVAEEAELDRVAVAHRSRPWQIVKATASGADEILIQGASKTVYPSQPLVIAGRGALKGPLRIVLKRGKEKRTLEFEPRLEIASPAAARLYGQLAVERLEPYAENLAEVTIAFARYFRVPGRTCSMVMLETAEDYQRFGVDVPPEEDHLVIASTSVAGAIEEQDLELQAQRQNPRKRFLVWVDSLESASLLNVSTALRLAMKRLPDSAFRFDAEPLVCRSWKTNQLDSDFLEELELDAPGFDAVMREAERRYAAFGADDALKTASTLVEAKSSDADTLRSVAFRAIEWQRSDQAAPLLWRLAQGRPYQPQCLLLLARAAAESSDIDAAIVCYDLVSSGNWNDRWSGAKKIAEIELLHVLEKVDSGEVTSALPQYARARLQQLRTRWCDEGMDLAVIMHWNTDRTDVDLHVTEPSGEECYYSHNQTKSGGALTQDITQGLGPEMYTLETAPSGDYRVEAKYYSADQNRTKAPTETLLTVMKDIGRPNARAQTKRIALGGTGEKQLVLKASVKH